MLSGFLLYYHKHTLDGYPNFLKWLGYVWKKIKRFWPLHFLTFLYAFFVFSEAFDASTLRFAVLNGVLLHAFCEKTLYNFNSLSWYLSATIFLYTIGFFLMRLINKFQEYWMTMIGATLLIIFVINAMLWLDVPIYVYGNPVYRMLDFFLGMLVGYAFVNNKVQYSGKDFSKCELLICLAFVGLYVISIFLKPKCGYYSILFAIALFVFAHGKGCVSELLGKPFFTRVAEYRFEFCMIHELVLRTLRLLIPVNSIGYFPRVFLVCGIAFFITSLLAILVCVISEKIS